MTRAWPYCDCILKLHEQQLPNEQADISFEGSLHIIASSVVACAANEHRESCPTNHAAEAKSLECCSHLGVLCPASKAHNQVSHPPQCGFIQLVPLVRASLLA